MMSITCFIILCVLYGIALIVTCNKHNTPHNDITNCGTTIVSVGIHLLLYWGIGIYSAFDFMRPDIFWVPIMLIALNIFSFIVDVINHGKHRKGNYNVWLCLINIAIMLGPVIWFQIAKGWN